MDDLISRQAVLNLLHALPPEEVTTKAMLIQSVKQMDDAQPEPRWIPCSERLPDRFGKMLVTFIPAAGTLWTRVIIANYSDLMGISKPCFWIGNVGKNDFANITSQVVAWMPLPEPYKEK